MLSKGAPRIGFHTRVTGDGELTEELRALGRGDDLPLLVDDKHWSGSGVGAVLSNAFEPGAKGNGEMVHEVAVAFLYAARVF